MRCYLNCFVHVVEVDYSDLALGLVGVGKHEVGLGWTNCAYAFWVRESLELVKHFEIFEIVDEDLLLKDGNNPDRVSF